MLFIYIIYDIYYDRESMHMHMVHGVIKRENQKRYLGEKDWSWQRGVHKKGRDKRELRKWLGIYLLGSKGIAILQDTIL
jgi:hypothetical protein